MRELPGKQKQCKEIPTEEPWKLLEGNAYLDVDDGKQTQINFCPNATSMYRSIILVWIDFPHTVPFCLNK